MWKANDAKWLTVDVVGSSGGILITWKSSKWDLVSSSSGTFLMSMIIQDKSSSSQYLLSVIYGPISQSLRASLWDELSQVRRSFSGPWCVVGDFNITRYPEDHSRRRRPSSAMARFSNWIQQEELIDLPLLGARFTWTNGRASPIQSRLDRLLVSPEWLEAFLTIKKITLPRTTSDHYPILLTVEDENWGPKPFRFNSSWLHLEGLHQKIVEWWKSFQVKGFAGHKLLYRLKLLKEKLKEWRREETQNREAKIEALMSELQKIDRVSKEVPMSK
ncbi:uncharacterized protein LOC131241978 [Magnolia sinica]|uniref:uncharacterized protein LOC131241978 n=1 Tax=Magnolia sinica TaxID=86752 RepID=UPI00265B3A80|nr:uncharacterized protein LOC131241978 [Magnolia sinica]